ncbi:uncharacterized protein NEMAJ01_1941 [Nematocida major]|uniref:uncharacterized protein n=1 Tax=Nematocida major TaxID=1912982 RepID=UPI00200862A2|nr:uncharacterized protein NEMAJ01_1941 [Nematocida major]KAH9387045.1 hypothetical protein NEMAJ01_1941 [Nematocida major]
MSIAEQLKKVREQTTTEKGQICLFREWKGEPDILFYARVEEAKELFSIYHGSFYERVQRYFEYFTDERSKDSRRDRMTERENHSLSKRMKTFLEELQPYMHHEYAQIVLEWLIRRYRIDKQEFDHLAISTIRVPCVQDILYESLRTSLTVENPMHEILACHSLPQYIGKALAKAIAPNVHLLKTLKHIEEDADTVGFVVFLEAVSGSLFSAEGVKEEVIEEWVDSVLGCRSRLLQKKATSAILGPLESILLWIVQNHDLVDDVAAQINAFRKKVEAPAAVHIEEQAHKFITLYAHFKRTGEKSMLLAEHPAEFVQQLAAEKEEVPCWLEVVKEAVFGNLLLQGSVLLSLFLEKTWLAHALSADPRWGALAKKHPTISTLVTLDEKKNAEIFTKKFMKCFCEMLPNPPLEKWLFRKAAQTEELKLALSVILPVVSDSTIEAEVSQIETWEKAVLFIKEPKMHVFLQNISKDLLVGNFLQYASAISKFENYTPLVQELSQEEKDGLLAAFRKRQEKKKLSGQELLFTMRVYNDLGAPIEALLSVGEKVAKLPEQERKRPVKAMLELFAEKEGAVNGSRLLDIVRSVESVDIDTTLSVLVYRAMLALEAAEAGSLITSGLLLPETLEARVLRLLCKDNAELVSRVFAKCMGSLEHKEVIQVASAGVHTELLVAGISQIFEELPQDIKIKLIQVSIEQRQSGAPLLFDELKKRVLPEEILRSVAGGSKYSVALALDTAVEMVGVDAEASEDSEAGLEVSLLLLNTLLLARKMSLGEHMLLNWERGILPMKNMPTLLARKMKESSASIVKGLVSRYLKKNLSSTVLLLALVQEKVADSAMLLSVLKHSPSSKSRVLLLRDTLRRPGADSLAIVQSVLQDRKSPLIRYYVQSRLPHIVKAVLRHKDTHPGLVSEIIGNLVRREKNVMYPYVADMLNLIKQTRKKSLVRPLAKIELRHLIGSIESRKDLMILKEYVRYRMESLEEEEVGQLASFYIERIHTRSGAQALVELFPAISDKHAVWVSILKQLGGFTEKFVHILLRVSKFDRKGECMASLSCVYSRLENILIDALESSANAEILTVMRRFFMHEKSTLVSVSRILDASMQSIAASKKVPALVSALFYSQSVNSPSEAEEINHRILVDLVKAEGDRKAALFRTLEKAYSTNPIFITRILGQSAPYFAILLESKDRATREKAEHLMKHIKEVSEEDPYRFL